jgi:hypothetical protein
MSYGARGFKKLGLFGEDGGQRRKALGIKPTGKTPGKIYRQGLACKVSCGHS